MSEQQLDVAGSFRLLRDRWRTWLLFVVLGLAVSVGYVVLRSPLYTATSLVLLPGSLAVSSTQAATGNDMTTAAQVATSGEVLTLAGRKVDPAWSLALLKQRVSAVGVATNVLRITAAGATGAQAEKLANAVATQLVSFETTTGTVGDQSALATLQANAARLTSQINGFNGEITAANNRLAAEGTSSAAGLQDSALIATLITEQNQATLQLDNVNTQIAQAQLGALAADQGTEVIQHAVTASPPSILHEAYVGIAGVLGGLFLGAVLILVRHRRDHRLHRRDEVADALGIPVLISMTAPRRRMSISDWVKLLERYSPSAADRWSVRQALRDLELGGAPAHLTVLVIAGDSGSMAAAPQIAVVLSTLGVPTAFVLSLGHEFSAHLRVACDRFSSKGNDPRPNLQVWNGALPEDAEAAALIVSCIVVDGARPKLPLIKAVGTTLLAVSAGFGTAEELARVAIAAADAGVPVKGMVLTNSDVDDRTTGRFPEVTPRATLAMHVQTLTTRGLAP